MPRTLAEATAGLTLGVNIKKAGKTLDRPGSFEAWERLVFTLCRTHYDGTGNNATSAMDHCLQPALDQIANGQAPTAPQNAHVDCSLFCETLLLNSISDVHAGSVRHLTNPWDIYFSLRQSLMSSMAANKTRIKADFDKSRLMDYRSREKSETAALDEWISKLHQLRHEYIRVGGVMEEEEVLRHVKTTLPPEYNETRATLASWMGAQDTLSNLRQYLNNYISLMPNFTASARQRQLDGPNDALLTTSRQQAPSPSHCRDFQRGRCSRGDKCRFAHASRSSRPLQDTTPTARKTQLCFNFQRNACSRGDSCRFAHIDPKQVLRAATAAQTGQPSVNLHQAEDAADNEYYDTCLALVTISEVPDSSHIKGPHATTTTCPS